MRFVHPLAFFLAFAASAGCYAADVILEGCETLSFDKKRGPDTQVLKGNVRFRQEGTRMLCDSAYFYSGKNSFDAFGHVRVLQDTTSLLCDKMYYDGNQRLMQARSNVTLKSGHMTLVTEKLDYFRGRGYAYFDEGATLTDEGFNLVSRIGYYYPGSKLAKFQQEVVLNGQDYKIVTDSLNYNSSSSEAEVDGPSTILRDDYVITTTRAMMNNRTGMFRLFRRSLIESTDHLRTMVADTIYYNRNLGTARLFGNAEVVDRGRNMAGYGGYGQLDRDPAMHGYFTKNAYVKEFSQGDTLFMRADTLRLVSNKVPGDTIFERVVMGRHNVRFFRDDFQGKSEFMNFYSCDSMVYMVGDPVLWAGLNQLTGDTVRLYLRNRHPDWLHITGKPLVVQRDDSINYNQIAGKDLKGFFLGNNLRRVLVEGNAVSVYFPKDKLGDLVGVNHNIGQKMTVFIAPDRKLERIFLEPGTEGVMYPPFEAPDEVLFLNGFSWQQDKRPLSKADVLPKGL